MKLSIITINYNNAEGLRKTLASVAAQTYRDIEHIIIDGGSTDGSVDVIKEYVRNVERMNVEIIVRDEARKERMNVIWSSEPDMGIYNAMNKGVEIALGKRVVDTFNRSTLCGDKNKGIEIVQGKRVVNSFNRSELVEDNHTSNIIHNTSHESQSDYIQILNSGDVLATSDVTERMIKAIEEVENPSILYGNMIRDFGNGKTNRDTCLGESRVKNGEQRAQKVEWTMDDFIKGTVNHDPTYIRADLYKKYGAYDENLKICSDWKWFVNAVVFGGEKLYYVPIDVTIFDTTGISETNLAAREAERKSELDNMLPTAILKDYEQYHFPIDQYKRLKRHHMWGLVYFMERVLFKLEKWKILK